MRAVPRGSGTIERGPNGTSFTYDANGNCITDNQFDSSMTMQTSTSTPVVSTPTASPIPTPR